MWFEAFTIKGFVVFDESNGRIHENQVGEILPYQFGPEPSTKTSDASDDNDTDQSDVTTSSDEDVDRKFKRANAWRLLDLSWCKCGHCSSSTEAVECFCCHEKALEYEVQTVRYKLHAVFVAYIVY